MRFAVKAASAASAAAIAFALLPGPAMAASAGPERTLSRTAPIGKIKMQMWTFTCSNPAPYQYQNATYRTGVPDKCMWAEVQELAYEYGYRGPVDGVMGPNSWKGFQAWLNDWGYNAGAVDGVPGNQTYSAMQRLASQHGYTGPIDGVMGPNSWKGFGYAMNRLLFAP